MLRSSGSPGQTFRSSRTQKPRSTRSMGRPSRQSTPSTPSGFSMWYERRKETRYIYFIGSLLNCIGCWRVSVELILFDMLYAWTFRRERISLVQPPRLRLPHLHASPCPKSCEIGRSVGTGVRWHRLPLEKLGWRQRRYRASYQGRPAHGRWWVESSVMC